MNRQDIDFFFEVFHGKQHPVEFDIQGIGYGRPAVDGDNGLEQVLDHILRMEIQHVVALALEIDDARCLKPRGRFKYRRYEQ